MRRPRIGTSRAAGPAGAAGSIGGRSASPYRESLIANANPATFAKRAREQEKKRKADDKRARRAVRKQAAKSGPPTSGD